MPALHQPPPSLIHLHPLHLPWHILHLRPRLPPSQIHAHRLSVDQQPEPRNPKYAPLPRLRLSQLERERAPLLPPAHLDHRVARLRERLLEVPPELLPRRCRHAPLEFGRARGAVSIRAVIAPQPAEERRIPHQSPELMDDPSATGILGTTRTRPWRRAPRAVGQGPHGGTKRRVAIG